MSWHKRGVKQYGHLRKSKVVNGRVFSLEKDPRDSRDYKFGNTAFMDSHISMQVDHSRQMSPVKDQGSLGSCVAFAVAALKEWQEQREFKIKLKLAGAYLRSGWFFDVSEQWIYYMSKKIDPWPNQEGTSIRYAMKVLHKVGAPDERAWGYNDESEGDSQSWSKSSSRWQLISSYYRIEGINELKAALSKSPVPIGVGCFEEMPRVGSNGIIPDPTSRSRSLGGHAVCAVGYDDAQGLIKFKNSWSVKWGQDGYGYLSYDYINKYLWDAWVGYDASISKDDLKPLHKYKL